MDLAFLLPLAVLALIDSTSFGTLVIPVVMLVQPRIRAAALLTYLGTISAFYLALGLVLTFAGAELYGVLPSRADHPWLAWTQLGVGAALFAGSFLVDKRGTAWRARRREAKGMPPKETRHQRLKSAVIGPDASARGVVGVALIAGLVEAASMVPYLAAIAMIVAADLSVVTTVGVLTAYVVVMALPALLLLGIRVALARRVEPALQRLAAWLDKISADTLGWVLGVVGVLLALDAWSVINPFVPGG